LKKYQAIVFLADGTSWTEIGGTSICIIDDEEHKMLMNGTISAQDLDPIFEIGLGDCTPPIGEIA
jgi:hypothetical protein